MKYILFILLVALNSFALAEENEKQFPRALSHENISNTFVKAQLAISEKYPNISLADLSILEFKYAADSRPTPRYTIAYKIIGSEKTEELPTEGISKVRKTIDTINVTLNVNAEVMSVSMGTISSIHSVL